ncbi:hypothetical protein PICMEDRAFT_116688 [Pichia membranifaciens NRRL Y-2026]|uniref:Uncharacterized protein n=1 Tax=Pichia membranifaciens NRRL Y-2026 TaxID=763406 RepID=A0A1E3NPH8_9ASCO|nr:hypothetical protein PICMEDRAFT_116688 [Pichia membranifaciens NRRL Y-2026]ODQ47618.1 hypothetical protein PICMEDRAFT_116688 [Pichia membranifaciens NRRL Y-2026]
MHAGNACSMRDPPLAEDFSVPPMFHDPSGRPAAPLPSRFSPGCIGDPSCCSRRVLSAPVTGCRPRGLTIGGKKGYLVLLPRT